ncbi:uncharacterized protein LOC116259886 [Nymphaea colorata]|nr:uncharacterized protein LOC116259886 [Nymphaea colorata]
MGWSRSMRKERGASGGVVAGCMSGMLQLFDFRQEIAVDTTTSSSSQPAARPPPEDGLCCTGFEAPRNSLEILPTAGRVVAFEKQQRRQDDDDEEIPMAFEIFTRPTASKDSTSPNPKCKSPSVVARLMGIEILPDEVEKEAGGGGGGGGGVLEGDDSSGLNSIGKDRTSTIKKLSHPREMKLKELNRELRHLEKRCENIIRQDRILTLSRSLPESPRISSARRSDAEHRLSLQIQKENVPPFANIGYADGVPLASSPSSSTSSFSLRNLDTKRATLVSNAGRPTSPRLVPSSNSPRLAKTTKEETRHSSTSPCSPRLRLRGQEECTNKVRPRPENQTAASSPKNNSQKAVTRLGTTPAQAMEPKPRATKSGPRLGASAKGKPRFEVSAVKGNKGGVARTAKKDRSPPKIRESYVRVLDIKSGTPKKGQKPICDHLLKAHSVIPTTKASSRILLRTPVSGVAPPPPSRQSSAAALDASVLDRPTSTSLQLAPALPKRPRLNSLCSSSSLPISIHDTMPSSSPSSAPAGDKGSVVKDTMFVYEYIKNIFELMGVRSNTKVSFINWYSPSHPLDPAILIKLDAWPYHHGRPGQGGGGHHHGITMPDTRSSRKLVFQLVDEMLRERLRPHLCMRPWMMLMMMGQGPCTTAVTGKQLLDEVWTETRCFPSADCKILQDIDGLVANDVNSGHFSSPINDADAESVSESILFRIGQDIADSLVGETVVDLLSL